MGLFIPNQVFHSTFHSHSTDRFNWGSKGFQESQNLIGFLFFMFSSAPSISLLDSLLKKCELNWMFSWLLAIYPRFIHYSYAIECKHNIEKWKVFVGEKERVSMSACCAVSFCFFTCASELAVTPFEQMELNIKIISLIET